LTIVNYLFTGNRQPATGNWLPDYYLAHILSGHSGREADQDAEMSNVETRPRLFWLPDFYLAHISSGHSGREADQDAEMSNVETRPRLPGYGTCFDPGNSGSEHLSFPAWHFSQYHKFARLYAPGWILKWAMSSRQ
jgi:hypothetical protein